jgi:hypothetical protein
MRGEERCQGPDFGFRAAPVLKQKTGGCPKPRVSRQAAIVSHNAVIHAPHPINAMRPNTA